MEWLAFIFVCWAAVRFLGRSGCALDARRLRAGAPVRRSVQPPLETRPVEVKPPAAAETAEQRLRRQYVEGTLTVEQYERELDALYRRI